MASSISLGTFFAGMFSSNAAKQVASAALQAGKNAAKDIGMKAIDMGKTVAIDVGTAVKAGNHGFAARHAYLIQSSTVKGTFAFRIPMKHIFGFREDYDKIVYGMKHNLTLVRKADDDAIFRAAAAGTGKVRLDKFFMVHASRYVGRC